MCALAACPDYSRSAPAASAAVINAPVVASAVTGAVRYDGGFATTLRDDADDHRTVPAVQGTAQFWLNPDRTALSYRVILEVAGHVTQAHIDMGPTTGSGPIVAWLEPTPPPSLLATAADHDVVAEGTLLASDLVGPFAGLPLDELVAAISAGETHVNIQLSQSPLVDTNGQFE